MSDLRDKFRGCLIGGAAGDALGYEVEFMSLSQIQRIYGKSGITEYALHGGLARISDDTQMTMFTANGLLRAAAMGLNPTEGVRQAYCDWFLTQMRSFPLAAGQSGSWLTDLPEMFAPRAPGNTCLSALSEGGRGTLAQPVNHSKGCGGVMRVAPSGLIGEGGYMDYTAGAEAAALTHGHPLGWLPAAALAHIVRVLANGTAAAVRDAAAEAASELEQVFPQTPDAAVMRRCIEQALELAERGMSDEVALSQLGEGWVGEEALAVAVYCAVKYEDDFDRALIAAVNHDGDSDSTGAVCGNILGAKIGYDAIPEKYKTNLELHDTILTLADDLYSMHDPAVTESSEWKLKYDREYYGDYDEDEEWEDDE